MTSFTIRVLGKDSQKWDVSLGKSILDGKGQATILAMAENDGVIALQGTMRKHCPNDASGMAKWLHGHGYPEASVTMFTETEKSKINKATQLLIDKFGMEKAMAFLNTGDVTILTS